MKIALLLRGHIRHGLTDRGMLNYVKKLARRNDVDIYCHTWSEHEAKSSYRTLDRSVVLKVTPDIIHHYFQEVAANIRTITISDDSTLQLNGRLEGTVSGSIIPILAWKRMWAGKAEQINGVLAARKNYDMVINTRFDYFVHSLCSQSENVLKRMLLQRGKPLNFKYPHISRNFIGVDNFYCGELTAMHKLITDFHTNLDGILEILPTVAYQEQLVYEYAKHLGYTA